MPPTEPPATTQQFEYLLDLQNVLAVEYHNPTATVHVWVSQKLAPDDLDPTDNVVEQIPDTFAVNVHDVGMGENRDAFDPLTLDPDTTTADVDVEQHAAHGDRGSRHRPITAGLSENHESSGAATGGLPVRVTTLDTPTAAWDRDRVAVGDIVRLSNMHVYGNANAATLGDAVLQPSRLDGGTDADAAGTYCGGIDLAPGVEVDVAARTVDLPDGDATGAYEMPNMVTGVVRSGYQRLMGHAVRKGGRTTGISDGEVVGVNATGNVKYNDELGVVRMPNQLLVTDISRPGDSGSPVYGLDGPFDGQILGNLYAGNDNITLVNKAGVIEQTFGVRFMPERLTSLTESIDVPMDEPTLSLVSATPQSTPGKNTPVALTVRVESDYDLDVWVRAAGPMDADEAEVTPSPDAETGSGTYEFDVELEVTSPGSYAESFSVNLEGGHVIPDGELGG